MRLMNVDDLIKPLKPTPREQWHGIVLPIAAGTLSGVFSGLVILFGADPDRGKPLSPAAVPQPALAESVQQTAAVPAPAPAMPTAKTITLTVVDSQTGARREVIVPASTDDQSEEGKPVPARSAAATTLTDTVGARGAAKSKRH
jgi:hypothetical protein